jgi:hypothetical protein
MGVDMVESVSTNCDVFSGLRSAIIGCALTLAASGAGAAPGCPKVITTPSGSVFDIASLISDNGSPEAALSKLRSLLSKLDGGARCNMLRDVNACNETVELAKRAVVALEACSVPASRGNRAQGGAPKKYETETGIGASPHE